MAKFIVCGLHLIAYPQSKNRQMILSSGNQDWSWWGKLSASADFTFCLAGPGTGGNRQSAVAVSECDGGQ